ncbi:MAG: trypsin-like peptidase domain-containing protein [Clostridia bacterium]|nr:trypsin-like peptidase domain-containing protein [Clostridia bacterium]
MSHFEKDPNDLYDGDEYRRSDGESPSEPEEQSPADEEETPYEEKPYSDRNEGYGYSDPREYSQPQYGKPKKQKNGTSPLLIAFCLVLFIFIGISVGAIFDLGRDTNDPAQTTGTTSDGTSGTGASSSNTSGSTWKPTETAPGTSVVAPNTDQYVSIFREVANKCLKTVVEIYVQTPTGSGAGSGVIYDPNGYIVTNYHVADETCTSITVILYDGTEYQAQYIYGDELADLAVIKIEKTGCDYAVFGDSDHLTYGDMVLAIGNPQGLGLSVTDGIISRPGEAVTIGNATMTLLRTSAAVNSGNSGGGLFNLKGELIGIVNAKLAANTVDNIGYAIPSTTVVKCINDLKDHGYITGRARLGVTVNTKQYQISWVQTLTIIQVAEISENGSAANSDLRVGDILIRYEDQDITSFEILSQQLTKYSVGDTVKLTVLRPTIELTGNNLQQYINTAKEMEIEITFVEFNPNAQ